MCTFLRSNDCENDKTTALSPVLLGLDDVQLFDESLHEAMGLGWDPRGSWV